MTESRNAERINQVVISDRSPALSLLNGARETMKLPPFTTDGVLPPGDFELTFDELQQSILVCGPDNSARYLKWDQSRRKKLVESLADFVSQLWQVGINEVFVGGSFVEDKDHPSDIDVYFECEPTQIEVNQLETHLMALNPVWSGISKQDCRLMRTLFAVHMLPHFGVAYRFDNGPEVSLPIEFRKSKEKGSIPRGIVKILRAS